MSNQSDSPAPADVAILTSEPTLSAEEIKRDIKKCTSLIQRTDRRIQQYKKQLQTATLLPQKERSLIDKGLALLKLTKTGSNQGWR